MYYSWEKSFKKEFQDLLKPKSTEELKIIIGQEPYKQQLNGINFKVSSSKKPYYSLENTVAFFVTDWIKIQDSLEMVFNLLFNRKGNKSNGINVLSYLRENNIPSDEFADYLYKKYSIILTNITNNYDNDNINNIKGLINKIKKPTYLLLVGNKAQQQIGNIRNNHNKGYVEFIHPSGNNLNRSNTQEDYFKNWYDLKDKSGSKQNIVNKFIIFK